MIRERAEGMVPMAEKWHSGISMHKLPVASGFIGLIFTVGCALIFLLGLPQLWVFLAFSAALGVGLAFVFRRINNRRSEHAKPLSILSPAEPSKVISIRSSGDGQRPKDYREAWVCS